MMEGEEGSAILMQKYYYYNGLKEEPVKQDDSSREKSEIEEERKDKERNVVVTDRILKPNEEDLSPPPPEPDKVSASESGATQEPEPEFSIHKLPEEIWELILDNEVKEDQDKLSCCKASIYMDKMLTKTKPIWQFKMVLADVMQYLPKKDLLNCRFVCKQWQQDIDNNASQTEPDLLLNEAWSNRLGSIAEIDACLHHFAGHSGNPFIGRALHFSNDQSELAFHLKMVQLLTTFGEHIWYLRLQAIYLILAIPDTFYLLLKRDLESAPNLRQLRIDQFSADRTFLMRSDYGTRMQLMRPRRLRTPLPPMPHLGTLCYSSTPGECPRNLIMMIMMPYIGQLKCLRLSMAAGWQEAYSQRLVNLEKAFLMDVSSDAILGQLLRLNAPLLQELHLTFTTSPKISSTLLIQLLCQLPNLQRVNLNFEEEAELVDPEGDAEPLISSMGNKSVTCLQISHGPKFPYDFLRIFPSLEKLNVELSCPLRTYVGGPEEGFEDLEEEEDLQFYKMMEEQGDQPYPYESNIWTELPRLKRVDILVHENLNENWQPEPQHKYLFNREGYRNYQYFKREEKYELLKNVWNGRLHFELI